MIKREHSLFYTTFFPQMPKRKRERLINPIAPLTCNDNFNINEAEKLYRKIKIILQKNAKLTFVDPEAQGIGIQEYIYYKCKDEAAKVSFHINVDNEYYAAFLSEIQNDNGSKIADWFMNCKFNSEEYFSFEKSYNENNSETQLEKAQLYFYLLNGKYLFKYWHKFDGNWTEVRTEILADVFFKKQLSSLCDNFHADFLKHCHLSSKLAKDIIKEWNKKDSVIIFNRKTYMTSVSPNISLFMFSEENTNNKKQKHF